jgi:multidrug efflux pump subunit AcrA (membrane-fusion protein)
MQGIRAFLRRLVSATRSTARAVWRRYRYFPFWLQATIAALLLVGILALVSFLRGGGPEDAGDQLPVVTLAPAGSLSGGAAGASIIGTVRSVSEAELVAEAGGQVEAVNARVGQQVPAGFVIAELENATEAAQALSAQGSYDAAVAARAAVSPIDADANARNAYRSAYATLQTALTTEADQFFGEEGATGPRLLISAPSFPYGELSRERAALDDALDAWQHALDGADAADPQVLLARAQAVVQQAADLLTDLAEAANARGSNATPEQFAALGAARASVSGLASTLSSAREAYRSKSVSSTATADASVKQALGALRLAEANLEKTRVRAPIGGTVNFLPLHVGDYVASGEHVATVAQNGALEVIASASEEQAVALKPGQKVMVEGGATGTITAVAPALDPVTKQVEVDASVPADAGLVSGASVRLALPAAAAAASSTSPRSLPLSAVKLAQGSRVVFTVEEGRLVAHPVELGAVHGSQVEVLTAIPADLLLVTDARGLAEGQRVEVAGTAAAAP